MPEGVQGWDRYGYVNNNPLKYTDPSGHTYCDFGICHKPSGRKTNLQRALETAEIRFTEKETKGVITFWWGLDEYERYTLEVGGWTEGEYTDYITTSNRNAYLWEDPATYLIFIVSGGKLAPTIIQSGSNAIKISFATIIRQLILQFPKNYAPRISEQTDLYHDFPQLLDSLIIKYGDLMIKSSNYVQFNAEGNINNTSGIFEIGVQFQKLSWIITHHFFNPNP